MRRMSCKIGLKGKGMLFAALLVLGCSAGDDVLDELGWRWGIREAIVVKDGDEERHEIDVTTSDPASITIVVKSNEDNDSDLFLYEIVLDIVPTSSSSPPPPEIGKRTYTIGNWLDANGGTYTVELIFLTAGRKAWYLNEIGGETAFDTFWADYFVNITVRGSFSMDDLDDDVTIEDDTWFTVIKSDDEEEANTYTVIYNGNGADGGSVPVDGNAYGQNDSVTVLGNTGGLTNGVLTFAGWNTAADGSGTTYSGGGTFTMGTADVTLYAIWVP